MALQFYKVGIFWRLDIGNFISKKRFLTKKAAIKYYYSHQDRHGFPVVRKEKK